MNPRRWLFLYAIFWPILLFAQTGPGGIGDGNGTNGPRNVLWLDASTLSLINGSDVTSWSDLSGNSNTLSQQNTDPVPTFAENAFGSGLHAIRFDGTERYLRITDNATLDGFSDGVSIFLVTNFSTVDGSPRGILSKRVSSSSEEVYSIFTFTSSRLNFDVRTTDDNRLADGNSLSVSTDYILSSVYDETFQYVSINGSNPSTRSETGEVANTSSDLILGALNNNYGTYFDGDLAEVIIFGAGLTQAERIIVENYLANKYSIGITNDLWSDNATYSNDITGIGQEATYNSEATSGKSSLIRVNESDDLDDHDWVLIGHDNGDISSWVGTEVPGSEQRLAREWLVEEANDAGVVTISVESSELPSTGFAVPNYFLLVDSDGDADFSNATRHAMVINGSGATVNVNLSNNDRIAIAFEGGDESQVWYSYLSGNWNSSGIWTLDGAVSPLYVNPMNEIPSTGDSVVIQSGRTVTMDMNDVAVTRLEIIGTLDLAATTGHTFGVLDGSGTLRLSGASTVENYPATNDDLFVDADEGGTLEYYGTGLTINNDRSANNLLLNMTSASNVLAVLGDLTINGNLNVTQGALQFNDNSSMESVNVSVFGDVQVGASGVIDVGTANARHEFNLHGDFINQGDVDFTNRTSQNTGSEATDGIVDVNFVSATQDQTVLLKNTTDFYRIEVNKGVDDTYVLDLSATDASYFNLYGYANESTNSSQGTTNSNALGLIYGTIKVGNNITISPLNAGGNYSIYEGSQLWVDGGTVEKTGGTAIVPYGAIRVSGGLLNAPINSGITTRDNGQLTIEGGTVTVNQFRTSINGVSALGGLVMSGGIFNIIGGSTSTNYYTFSLTYSGNVFNMSGGVINLAGVNSKGGIYINSSDENINVTGGVINLDVTNGNNVTVTSRAPFFNMNVLRSTASGTGSVVISGGSSGSGGGETTLNPTEMKILNDLRVDNSHGHGTAFDANDIALTITGSLDIDAGSTVDLSNMNLKFNGLGSSTIDIGLASTLMLDSLEISKSDDFSNLEILNGQSTALQIDDYLNITKGSFRVGSFNANINGAINISDTIGTSTSTGVVQLNGGAAQSITSTNGVIYDLTIDNSNGVSLTGDLEVDALSLNSGIFNINTSKLTMGSSITTTGSFGTTLMVQTAGNASDGGIGIDVLADGTYLYPFGVASKYTPVSMDITLANMNTGEVAIRPVDAELSTTLLTGGNMLSYYWKVGHTDFGATDLPTVNSYTFTFDATDVSAGTPDTEYVSGKVLDGGAFTRSYEGDMGVQVTSNTILFNGLAAGDDGTGATPGFTIENSNYTAGESARFVGEPFIYYTKDSPVDGGYNFLRDWDDASIWVRSDQLTDMNGDMVIDEKDWHRGDNPNAPDFPDAGDVAVIGFIPWEDPNITNRGLAHHLNLSNETEACAELIFTQMKDASGDPVARTNIFFALRPSVLITGASGQLNADVVSGEGQFFIRFGGDPDFSVMDLGDFIAEDSSIFFYEAASNRTYNNAPSVVSNLILGTSGWGRNDLDIQFSNDLSINQNLEILGNTNLILSNGASGDLSVSGNLIMFETDPVPLPCCGGSSQASGGGAEITFPNSGNARNFSVSGNVDLQNAAGTVHVSSPGTTPLDHTFTVFGDIVQSTTSGGGLQFYSGAGQDRISLILSGAGNHSFTKTSGADPTLYRMIMNKGSDTTSTFSMNGNFTLNGDNTSAPQSIELQNGKLILNNASLNLELANGSDFQIPGSAGLEVTQGVVTSTGANLILSGLLRVNGGTVNLGTSDIEYSNTGSALIEVTSGTLNVGGQVRRATSSTTGILKYRQTGGDVDIATDGASTSSRGAFEVLNTGSEFTLTGGTFNIERGVTGDANISLELDPDTYDISGSTITIFENLGANYGANLFNIASSISLNNLTIANSIDLPDVQLFTQNLVVNDLTINTAQTLLSNGFNLTLNGTFTNNGTYTNTSTETIFAGAGAQSVLGSGTFTIHTLRKNGSGTTVSNVSLSLGNDFYLTGGTFDVGANSLSLQNDAYIQSTFSNSGGEGLVFNGTANQDLNGLLNSAVDIGTITISNPSGVDIPDGNGYDFNITQELRLNGGVFNIGGSLVRMRPGAPVTEVSAFSVNNMVQTNSSFTDNGLKIEFYTVAADTTIFYPIGELKYTPVRFNLNAGTTAGGIRVRPANEKHPTIVNDTEPMSETEIDDTENVLQYHWIVVAEGLNNASGTAQFFYDHDDIRVTAPYDTLHYISARLLSNNVNWDKFAPTLFRGGTQTFEVPLSSFSASEITGDYTAGVGSSDGINNNVEGAIPDELAQYESVIGGSGVYSTAANWVAVGGSPVVTDGVGPVGAQIVVKNGDQVTIDISDVRLFSTEIEEGGTLVIPTGVIGVRLGNVSGAGTIVLEDNELLPTGEYTDFFACGGGGLQYSGSTDYSVLSGISQIRRVVFDGTGQRDMPNNSLSVCDTLIINGPTVNFDAGVTYSIGDADTDLFNIQSGSVTVSNASVIDVTGDFRLSGGAFTGSVNTVIEVSDDMDFSGGTLSWNGAKVTLDGAGEQLIDGAFAGSSAFSDLTINNTSSGGVTINSGSVAVTGTLTLTDGLVNTTTSQLLTLTSTGDWVGASSASYITGPIQKDNIAATANFQFPVGKPARYAPISIINVGTGGQDWDAEYFTSLGIYSGNNFNNNDPGSGFNALTGIEATDRWQVASSGSNSAQLRTHYGSHNSHADQDNLRVTVWDDIESRWENQGGQIAGSMSTGTVTSENTVGFSTKQITMGKAPATTLPVVLLEFSGTIEGKSVHLNWTTASEINNDRFEIEWSEDGTSFIEIGQEKGNGTTEELQYYRFVDHQPVSGFNYYRLRQVDYDGQFEYSSIIAVSVQEFFEEAAFKIYPNPVTAGRFNLNLEGFREGEEITMTITNLSGQKVLNMGFEATGQDQEVRLPQSTPTGIYVIIYQYRGQLKRDKLYVK